MERRMHFVARSVRAASHVEVPVVVTADGIDAELQRLHALDVEVPSRGFVRFVGKAIDEIEDPLLADPSDVGLALLAEIAFTTDPALLPALDSVRLDATASVLVECCGVNPPGLGDDHRARSCTLPPWHTRRPRSSPARRAGSASTSRVCSRRAATICSSSRA